MSTPAPRKTYRAGGVARMTGLTVRTLHHWDEIGLVRPTRDTNGYRAYDAEDLRRLHEVRVFQELELGLDEIRALLGSEDRSAVLTRQREALEARIERLMEVAALVERAAEAERAGLRLSAKELFEVFGDFDPTVYTEEVDARWDPEIVAESRRRTRSYDAETWRQIKAEAAGHNAAMAERMQAGEAATAPEPVAIAERMRAHIDRWYYPCPPRMHAALAVGYTDDPRFAAHYEAVAPGLAAYVRAAIEANAAG